MPPNHRCCISCRRLAHRSEFLRIVRQHPDRTITIGSGMGRSAYLCLAPDCIQLAQKKNRLSRALRAPVPPEIYQQIYEQLSPSAPN